MFAAVHREKPESSRSVSAVIGNKRCLLTGTGIERSVFRCIEAEEGAEDSLEYCTLRNDTTRMKVNKVITRLDYEGERAR